MLPDHIKKYEVKVPSDITSFESDSGTIVYNLYKKLMYEFNYIIGHLICEDDGVSKDEAEIHNFQVALFGGFITHRGRKRCRYFSNLKNKIEKFTDKRPELKYSTIEDAKQNIISYLNEI